MTTTTYRHGWLHLGERGTTLEGCHLRAVKDGQCQIETRNGVRAVPGVHVSQLTRPITVECRNGWFEGLWYDEAGRPWTEKQCSECDQPFDLLFGPEHDQEHCWQCIGEGGGY